MADAPNQDGGLIDEGAETIASIFAPFGEGGSSSGGSSTASPESSGEGGAASDPSSATEDKPTAPGASDTAPRANASPQAQQKRAKDATPEPPRKTEDKKPDEQEESDEKKEPDDKKKSEDGKESEDESGSEDDPVGREFLQSQKDAEEAMRARKLDPDNDPMLQQQLASMLSRDAMENYLKENNLGEDPDEASDEEGEQAPPAPDGSGDDAEQPAPAEGAAPDAPAASEGNAPAPGEDDAAPAAQTESAPAPDGEAPAPAPEPAEPKGMQATTPITAYDGPTQVTIRDGKQLSPEEEMAEHRAREAAEDGSPAGITTPAGAAPTPGDEGGAHGMNLAAKVPELTKAAVGGLKEGVKAGTKAGIGDVMKGGLSEGAAFREVEQGAGKDIAKAFNIKIPHSPADAASSARALASAVSSPAALEQAAGRIADPSVVRKGVASLSKFFTREAIFAAAETTGVGEIVVILEVILGVVISMIFIVIVVMVADGDIENTTDTKIDPRAAQEEQAPISERGPLPSEKMFAPTAGFLASDPAQLLGLTTEMMLVLNRCGEAAPVDVTMGVGGAPGTARYDGRAVRLSTQAVAREAVVALEGCLAQQGGACVEELLGPDPGQCIAAGPPSACEAQRAERVRGTNGEISYALRRGCTPPAAAVQ